MRAEIPSDALVVLIGPAGCGKSTFAARHFRRTQIVSSDECRALVADDPTKSTASDDAFALMHFIVDKRLKRGLLTVADATNVQADKRAVLLGIAEHHRRPVFAVVFDLPTAVCFERNRGRHEGRVPDAAVASHARQLREAMPTLAEEGFERILVLGDPADVDGVEVVVLPSDDRQGRPRK